ncbi:MAG: DEAD/DEAH box helicase [Planctomycetes bacterium]|jgi:ATP-dependent DNA helicase RecG|nr:DEAD/DEAH box helicase [Planctomycetota bacterium]
MATTGATGESATAPLDPRAPLVGLPGIGPTTAARLAAAGLTTVLDLVLFFPRRCEALHELEAPDEACCGELVRLRGAVQSVRSAWLPGRRSMVTVTFAGAVGEPFETSFFNQPWLKKSFPPGQVRSVEGVLVRKGKRFQLQQAKVLPLAAAPSGEVQLRYPELPGIAGARLQRWLAHALDAIDWAQVALPPLPAGLAEFAAEPAQLLSAMHRPPDLQAHDAARRHFAVREAVALFGAVQRARAARAQRPARAFPVDAELATRIRSRIPLRLTADQDHAIQELWRLLAGPAAMGVLLQGDVGTGKTAVAVAAALAVLAKGGTVVFLLPTELLAEQHHRNVGEWLRGSSIELVLHTANSGQKAAAERGGQLVFGTHALLAEQVVLPRLGLVVVDEQHRFGTAQRMALVHKGSNPHVLVMTATPIPRTLALVLFGDLDTLVLRERPPGRRPVRAFHVATENWARALRSIARAVRRRGRVFVVCPAVGEDGEKGGVVRVMAVLQPRFRCALVHGRLDAVSRRRTLASFRAGEVDVLVGTTVLEVGVDVPNATLMVVVATDRFGIATLHQLRGRVGRGARRGLCLLCGPRTARVDAICRTTDGFALAEADLALRGSGELLGQAQSGVGELKALDPIEDLELLRRVRAAVTAEHGS